MGVLNHVIGWTPDSKNVLFLSRRDATNGWTDLISVKGMEHQNASQAEREAMELWHQQQTEKLQRRQMQQMEQMYQRQRPGRPRQKAAVIRLLGTVSTITAQDGRRRVRFSSGRLSRLKQIAGQTTRIRSSAFLPHRERSLRGEI
jgi:hypothetical protein